MTKYSSNELLRLLIDAIVHASPLKDVQTVLRSDADPNGTLRQGLRPLHYAAYHNRADVIHLLCRWGADVNKGDDIGYTSLHIAAKHGFLACALALIENGSVVNFCDEGTPTTDSKVSELLTVHPLNLASENDHAEMMELLLRHGANPNQKYFIGHEINIIPLENTKCLEILLRYGGDPDAYSRSGITPIMKACKQGHKEAISLLINYGANVDKTCHPKLDQKRAIHYAVMSGNSEIARLLLDAGANTRQPPEFLYPPLDFAITQDKPKMCELLLQYGADPNEVNGNGCSMLQIACSTPELLNQVELIEQLLENGADPRFGSSNFSFITPCLTPLVEYLACNGEYDIAIVELLLRHGAEINLTRATGRYCIKDKAGVLAVLRKMRDFPDILCLLIEASGARDREATRQEPNLSPIIRAQVLAAAAIPASLKHLTRLTIQGLIKPPRPKMVKLLPLPPYIKNYLTYKAR